MGGGRYVISSWSQRYLVLYQPDFHQNNAFSSTLSSAIGRIRSSLCRKGGSYCPVRDTLSGWWEERYSIIVTSLKVWEMKKNPVVAELPES